MMQKYEFGTKGETQWLDFVNPSTEELEAIGREFALDPSSIHDCLQPDHLPKYELIENTEFVILRAFDDDCHAKADTTQDLTRKIAVFKRANILISIHRSDVSAVAKTRTKWTHKKFGPDSVHLILADLFLNVFTSFDRPIDRALDQLEALEMSIFNVSGAKPFELQEAYVLKRQSFIFRRLLRSTSDIFHKVQFSKSVKGQLIQNVRDEFESSMFYTEELTESTTALLNLHVSLSSQRTNEASQQTNEVVRVLTIFSVFLLPLNVVTGIYGMNFKNMPELDSPHGYYMALAAMVGITGTIFLWFRSKGFLRGFFKIDGHHRRADVRSTKR